MQLGASMGCLALTAGLPRGALQARYLAGQVSLALLVPPFRQAAYSWFSAASKRFGALSISEAHIHPPHLGPALSECVEDAQLFLHLVAGARECLRASLGAGAEPSRKLHKSSGVAFRARHGL